jgi:AraC-like DNA-binding protein
MHLPRPPRRFTPAHRQRLDRAANHYLQQCYRNRIPVRASAFATFLGMTHPYVSGMATQLAGVTLRQFLRAKQLAYAERLLRSTPLTVEQIALRSGFGSNATFYRCFREAYGMSPGSFREVKK